ncbi:unnamed protein product [Prunus armeniaca]|uniref:Uncharacterized protein n=1 Tax=Prunus armeniaca TaxID=36596 RepID=A0A6J5VAH5_PRUAR|nr:unnamed protein product [Prunus armeniaca]
MGLEDLIARLRIEEDNLGSEKKIGGTSMMAKAHVVEDGPKKRKRGSTQGKALAKGTQRRTKGSRENALTATSMVIELRTVKARENHRSSHERRGEIVE